MQIEEHEIQVRWPDLDGLGHINHSAVLVYLEVGRDAMLAAKQVPPDEYVVRHCVIDYLIELRPRTSHVRYQCTDRTLGTTSITLTEALLDDHGALAVKATFTLVMWDPANRKARKLTEMERWNLVPPTTEATEVR